MFLVLSRPDLRFGLEDPFFACPLGAQGKLRARKFGHLERNLSTPVRVQLKCNLLI